MPNVAKKESPMKTMSRVQSRTAAIFFALRLSQMSKKNGVCKAGGRSYRRAPGNPAAILSALGFMVLLVFAASYPDTGHAAFPGANGKIAFVSNRDGPSGEIYTMNSDGSGQTRLTNNPAEDFEAHWQPLVTISVEIDIKPGSFPNSINLKSKGVVPVAILGSASFNVDDVAVNTVTFTGASPVRFSFADVNLDGYVDLVFHFRTQDLQLTPAARRRL